MIVHVVLGKLRDRLNDAEAQEALETLGAVAAVPGVRSVTYGVNFSERSRGYTHGAVLEFESREALQAYLGHDEHVRIVQRLNRLMPERLVVDYEPEQ